MQPVSWEFAQSHHSNTPRISPWRRRGKSWMRESIRWFIFYLFLVQHYPQFTSYTSRCHLWRKGKQGKEGEWRTTNRLSKKGNICTKHNGKSSRFVTLISTRCLLLRGGGGDKEINLMGFWTSLKAVFSEATLNVPVFLSEALYVSTVVQSFNKSEMSRQILEVSTRDGGEICLVCILTWTYMKHISWSDKHTKNYLSKLTLLHILWCSSPTKKCVQIVHISVKIAYNAMLHWGTLFAKTCIIGMIVYKNAWI